MTDISSVQNSLNVSSWDDVTDMRHAAEDAVRSLYEKLIDDRHVLEAKISLLERDNRELRGKIASLTGFNV